MLFLSSISFRVTRLFFFGFARCELFQFSSWTLALFFQVSGSYLAGIQASKCSEGRARMITSAQRSDSAGVSSLLFKFNLKERRNNLKEMHVAWQVWAPVVSDDHESVRCKIVCNTKQILQGGLLYWQLEGATIGLFGHSCHERETLQVRIFQGQSPQACSYHLGYPSRRLG